MAAGELALEAGEMPSAETWLGQARRGLKFELVEEPILVLQSLGFIRLAAQDVKGALPIFEKARALLAEIWSEVI